MEGGIDSWRDGKTDIEIDGLKDQLSNGQTDNSTNKKMVREEDRRIVGYA
jgi:hypothetical protein